MRDDVDAMRKRAVAEDDPGLAVFAALTVAEEDARRYRSALREIEKRPTAALGIARAALRVDEERLRSAADQIPASTHNPD